MSQADDASLARDGDDRQAAGLRELMTNDTRKETAIT